MNNACSYCPTCSDLLVAISVLDIYANAYSCAKGHRFLHYYKEVLNQMSELIEDIAAVVDSTEEDMAVIKYWLTSEELRSRLNGQLAEMLQNIYWHCESDSHAMPDSASFCYCPVCKSKLENFEQDDIWFQEKNALMGMNFMKEEEGLIILSMDKKPI